MKKENKIMVVADPDPEVRRKMVARLAVELGFAKTASDASKIIRTSPYEYDLTKSYFVLAHSYDFRKSQITTQRLFEMAARGIAVVVGVKRLPAEYEFCCQVFFPGDN